MRHRLILFDPLCETEVRDVGAARRIDEDVRRLEVAVQDAAIVGSLHGVGHFRQQRGGLTGRQGAGRQLPCKRRALDESHAVEGEAVTLAHIEDRHDPRMVEPGRGFGLATKSGEIGPAGEVAAQEHFEGDRAAEALLRGAVDDAHTAAADLLDQLVIAEGGRKRRRAGREPRTARPDGGFTEHHLIDASLATLEHCGLFGDRVGHEHGGEEFAEMSGQVGMISHKTF